MENIIEVKDLVKKFGDFTAVDNISFSVKKGEIFAFLGAERSGEVHHHQDAHDHPQSHERGHHAERP